MPDDWIKKKLAEAAVRPSNDALFKSKTQSEHVHNIEFLIEEQIFINKINNF